MILGTREDLADLREAQETILVIIEGQGVVALVVEEILVDIIMDQVEVVEVAGVARLVTHPGVMVEMIVQLAMVGQWQVILPAVQLSI